ncbi:MAG: hypothetical protein NZ874_00270 [Fimbriimonadales bacterium]|nr:hypothetical protein [Fimbriimonadales bacterium]
MDSPVQALARTRLSVPQVAWTIVSKQQRTDTTVRATSGLDNRVQAATHGHDCPCYKWLGQSCPSNNARTRLSVPQVAWTIVSKQQRTDTTVRATRVSVAWDAQRADAERRLAVVPPRLD